MLSEKVLELFLTDLCKNRHIPSEKIHSTAIALYKTVKQYGAITVVLGNYTLTLHTKYPKVKKPGFMYVPIYLAY